MAAANLDAVFQTRPCRLDLRQLPETVSAEVVNRALVSPLGRVRAKLDTRLTRIEAEIKSQTVRIDAMGSRIDVLQRVIWPLIGLLTTTVLGLLYRLLFS